MLIALLFGLTADAKPSIHDLDVVKENRKETRRDHRAIKKIRKQWIRAVNFGDREARHKADAKLIRWVRSELGSDGSEQLMRDLDRLRDWHRTFQRNRAKPKEFVAKRKVLRRVERTYRERLERRDGRVARLTEQKKRYDAKVRAEERAERLAVAEAVTATQDHEQHALTRPELPTLSNQVEAQSGVELDEDFDFLDIPEDEEDF